MRPEDVPADGTTYAKRGQNGKLLVCIDGILFEVGNRIGEELLASLSKAMRPYTGYSIFDEIMLQLDAVIDRLMANAPAADGKDPGRAEAYAMALALIRNPYQPDYPGEKKRQMERYKLRQGPDDDGNTSGQRESLHKRAQRGI